VDILWTWDSGAQDGSAYGLTACRLLPSSYKQQTLSYVSSSINYIQV